MERDGGWRLVSVLGEGKMGGRFSLPPKTVWAGGLSVAVSLLASGSEPTLLLQRPAIFLLTATYRNTRRLILRTLVVLHRLYRNTRLLILRTLVQFYILPHTHPPPRRVCVYVRLSRAILPKAPGFRNSWKTDPVALEPSKQPKEVSTLIQTVGIKLSNS